MHVGYPLRGQSAACDARTRPRGASQQPGQSFATRGAAIARFCMSLTIAPPPCRPFRQWYEAHYGTTVGRKQKKKTEGEAEVPAEPVKQSKSVKSKIAKRQEGRVLDSNLNSQFDTGRLLAAVSSRPGQCGRCDGFILEGKELEFYVKRMARKKK